MWNADLGSDDNPIEANLGFVCRKDGKYLGSEAVENLRKNGVKRRLVNLHLKKLIDLLKNLFNKVRLIEIIIIEIFFFFIFIVK